MTGAQPLGDPDDNQVVDMVVGQQLKARSRGRSFWGRDAWHGLVRRGVSHALPAALFVLGLAVIGCGSVTCPESLSNVDGTCEKVDPVVTTDEPAPGPDAELCDGVDNDGDDAIDEDFELGGACGERAGVGECVAGTVVCAPGGRGTVCEGAIEPSAEICDGKDNDCDGIDDNGPAEVCDGEDNDCDGLVDEGALAVKSQAFGDHVTVAAVDGGFVVTRVVADHVRVETYDLEGNKTGFNDSVDRPTEDIAFIDSSSLGRRAVVALGQFTFHVLDVWVDSELIPIIVESEALHSTWEQGTRFGVHDPPYHPRVIASPTRFIGYRNVLEFALNPFGFDSLSGLTLTPTPTSPLPAFVVFDAAGSFVVWQQDDNLRGALVLDDGSFLVDIDVARGRAPSLAIGDGGPALLFVDGNRLRLSELGGLTLRCLNGGFCNDALVSPELTGAREPGALAYDGDADVWFVAAGEHLLAVARVDGDPVVTQVEHNDLGGELPDRVDAAVSGGTAAFVQTARNHDSVLTFMGCF